MKIADCGTNFVHSWVVQNRGLTVLIDTGYAEDWPHFLSRMAAADLDPAAGRDRLPHFVKEDPHRFVRFLPGDPGDPFVQDVDEFGTGNCRRLGHGAETLVVKNSKERESYGAGVKYARVHAFLSCSVFNI